MDLRNFYRDNETAKGLVTPKLDTAKSLFSVFGVRLVYVEVSIAIW